MFGARGILNVNSLGIASKPGLGLTLTIKP
jgi:hypothetical protein